MKEDRFDIRDNRPLEKDFENALRPLSFSDFSGQSKIVENLRIFVAAARMRTEPLDHVLLHGPPGLGKTTLSNIIANELGVGFKITSGPVLDKPGDLAGLLTSLEPNDVLFIDEIHRLSPIVEEYLYSAMEDYRIDIMIDKGPSARSIQLDLANENTPDADIVSLPKVTDIISELLSGKMDAAYIETVVAQSYQKNYPDLEIVMEVPYDVEGSAIGVCKDNPELLAAVNEAIKAATEDGSLDQYIADATDLAAGETYEGLLDDSGNVQ